MSRSAPRRLPLPVRSTLRRRAVAAAAAATLLALPGLPAQAQFYAWDGAVGSNPLNLFPIDGGIALLDFGANTLSVGNGAFGSFSALAGAQFSLGELSIANAGGNGSVVFDSAQVRVGGLGNRLTIGNSGPASLTVQGGALLDATVNADDCLPLGNCGNSFIGHGAGSTTTLAITGAGSEMRTLRYFGLGVAAVHPGMGTPGADSHTTLNLTAGGKLFTDGANISLGPGGSTPTGSEHTFVDVLIDGAGSRWTVLPNRFDAGSGASMYVATHANAQATIDVSNGGQLLIDSSGTGTGATFALGTFGQATLNIASGGQVLVSGAVSPQQTNMSVGGGAGGQGIVTVTGAGSELRLAGHVANLGIGGAAGATGTVTVSDGGLLRIDGTGPNSGIGIGGNGMGTLVITGAGSALETAGLGSFISVGANNSTGDGNFQLLAGGTASSLFMNVGRNGGKGELVIDGAGSQLTLSGVNLDPGSPGTAAGSIGRNGGAGTATVRNGGRWLITDGGQDGRSISGSPALSVGRDAGGQGALTITGAGSVVEIVATSLGLPAGTPDNFNPFVAIGRDNPNTASGTLMVSNGGKLILTGNAVSTPVNARVTGMNIGGRSGVAGTGSATVTGAGSEIIVQGFDAHLGVGYFAGSNGVLDVLNQGKVSSTSMTVGADAVGTVNVNNGLIALSGHRTDTSNVGAGITVGRGANGVGTLNLANGSSLTLDPTVLSGGMAVGGDQFLAGGSGTVTLSGGSSFVIGGPVPGGGVSVGRNGSGTLNLGGASLFDVGSLRGISLGNEAAGSGTLSVTGASKVLGNIVNIGGVSDTTAGGLGTATVSGLGSELRASGADGAILVGRSGVGSLSVTNQGTVAAIALAVGRANGGVGNLTVNNAFVELAGQQTVGSLAGAALVVGHRGGVGTATIGNGSLVTLTNLGTSGANLYVGGTDVSPLGTGTLTVGGGSQIKLTAMPGLAKVVIGHDGTGTASFSGASLLDAGDGDVIIAGEPGSTGTLVLSSGSVLNAAYVGVGSKPGGIDGGTGTLIVNNSTVNATTLEIGTFSLLAGNGGQINAQIINRGTIAPGNSPGRLIVDGGVRIIDEGKIVLDIQDNGGGGYLVDELVLVKGSSYDFGTVSVVFNFIGATDPNAFAATGGLDLDTFLRVKDANSESGLSDDFSGGATWNSLFAQASFSAASSAYDVISLDLKPDASGGFGIVAVPVPEPATWLLNLAGLAAVGGWVRRRWRAVPVA